MSIIGSNILAGVSGQATGYNINNSLRFRASASAYLNRTPASASNRTTWTWSGWVKLGSLSSTKVLFSACTSGNSTGLVGLQFTSSDTLQFFLDTGATSYGLITTQVFRDPSAWYHIVIALDTTQATSTNRIKLYINGSQVTAFGTATYPALNDAYAINNTQAHNIGRYAFDGTRYFDGYITEVNLVDGSQLTPSSFGETSTTTGSWVPKAYTGTYGTNGFYQKYSDIATTSGSNAGLGKDFSGNGNYWNTNNISVTAGTTYDAMIDVPTLTSATVGNYATLNPLKMPAPASASYTNGNLSVSVATANQTPALATIYPSSGKWYWEVTWTSGSYARLGVQNTTVASTDFAADVYGWRYGSDGQIYSGSLIMTVATYVAGDVLGFCLDCDAGKLYVSKNGTWQNSAVPESGTGAVATNIPTNTPMSPAVATGSLTSVFAFNAGQRPFSYTPPTGFVRLNTYNLPDSTIKKGNTVMDATLYTGNGSTQTITNAGAFKPDFVWVKTRNVGTTDHCLFDAVRGVSKYINSNNTGAEATYTGFGTTAFNSNGFTVVDNAGGGYLVNGSTGSPTYVGWQWQAGQGSTSSNTSGSITSTVSVNTTAGFSIVTYTGGGTSGLTVGHGLGVAPKWIIVKVRNTTNVWSVYHASLGNTKYMLLNNTDASATSSGFWNNTTPSSTVFTVGTDFAVNQGSNTYVAYCWAEIAGFSKFTSYTGNGSADGPFVYLGFRPKFIMVKRTDTIDNWYILDSARSTYNTVGELLSPNLSTAATSYDGYDFLSNGFKLRNTGAGVNASGGTYIVAAFAENPFKNSNAR